MEDDSQPTREQLQEEVVRVQREAIWMTHLTNARQVRIEMAVVREKRLKQRQVQLEDELREAYEEIEQLRLEREKEQEEAGEQIEELRKERVQLQVILRETQMALQSERDQKAALLDVQGPRSPQRSVIPNSQTGESSERASALTTPLM